MYNKHFGRELSEEDPQVSGRSIVIDTAALGSGGVAGGCSETHHPRLTRSSLENRDDC